MLGRLSDARSTPEWCSTIATSFEKQKTCSPACQGIAYTRRTVIPELKTCGVCERELPVAEFPIRPNGFPASPCNECKRVLNRVSYRRNGHKRGGSPPSRDPMKRHARALFQSAVRHGKIARQPCEVCGGKAEGHHEDYGKPFDVRWLCRVHHGMAHWKPVSTPILERAKLEIASAIRGNK